MCRKAYFSLIQKKYVKRKRTVKMRIMSSARMVLQLVPQNQAEEVRRKKSSQEIEVQDNLIRQPSLTALKKAIANFETLWGVHRVATLIFYVLMSKESYLPAILV